MIRRSWCSLPENGNISGMLRRDADNYGYSLGLLMRPAEERRKGVEQQKKTQYTEAAIWEPVGGELLQFFVIKSRRKTLGLEIKADGTMIIRAPVRMSGQRIRAFIQQKQHWIQGHREKLLIRQKERETSEMMCLSEQERKELVSRACLVFKEKAEWYSGQIGVTYGRITIRDQKTRWGSCSSKGNLNFNYRLLLAPEEVLDYVVVHELCHRKQMNHSDAFWAEVESVLPDYRLRRQWLKEHGWKLQQIEKKD